MPGPAVKSRPVNSAYLDAGEYWGLPEIAKYLGVEPSTARDYAADPARGFPKGTAIGGRKVYRADDVREWHANRPRPERQVPGAPRSESD